MGRLLATAAVVMMLGMGSHAQAQLIGDGRDTINGPPGGGGGEFLGDSRYDDWCGGCGRPMPRSVGLPDLSENGPPFYGYNPNLLAVGERALGRGRSATLRTANHGDIPGFIINGDFYAVRGTMVVRGVEPRSRPGGRIEAVISPPDRRDSRPRDSRPRDSRPRDSRPTPNPDRPSLRDRGWHSR